MSWPNISMKNKLEQWHFLKQYYLKVYRTRPSFQIRSRRLGVVIQWASDFLEFLKKVSGIQIFPTILLLSTSTFMVLLNFKRLSNQVWAKIISIVYSWKTKRRIMTCNSKATLLHVFFRYLNFYILKVSRS